MDRAKLISEEINVACETLLPPHTFTVFAHCYIQLEKLRIQAAGRSDPGPIRPPHSGIPADLAEGARECGRRPAELVEKYTH